MKLIILYINTSKEVCEIKLFDQGANLIDSATFDGTGILSEMLLTKIDQILKKNNIVKKKLTKIIVNAGPGSYTGVRIGVTVANLLATSLNIPVTASDVISAKNIIQINNDRNLREFTSPVMPIYSNPPYITRHRSGRRQSGLVK